MSTTTGAFIAGGLAACGAVTFTNGFEILKVRLQLQGELQAKAVKNYNGVLSGARVIVKNEGVKGLFRGIGAAVYDSFPPKSKEANLLTTLRT